jgi:hypothetical protein
MRPQPGRVVLPAESPSRAALSAVRCGLLPNALPTESHHSNPQLAWLSGLPHLHTLQVTLHSLDPRGHCSNRFFDFDRDEDDDDLPLQLPPLPPLPSSLTSLSVGGRRERLKLLVGPLTSHGSTGRLKHLELDLTLSSGSGTQTGAAASRDRAAVNEILGSDAGRHIECLTLRQLDLKSCPVELPQAFRRTPAAAITGAGRMLPH